MFGFVRADLTRCAFLGSFVLYTGRTAARGICGTPFSAPEKPRPCLSCAGRCDQPADLPVAVELVNLDLPMSVGVLAPQTHAAFKLQG